MLIPPGKLYLICTVYRTVLDCAIRCGTGFGTVLNGRVTRLIIVGLKFALAGSCSVGALGRAIARC